MLTKMVSWLIIFTYMCTAKHIGFKKDSYVASKQLENSCNDETHTHAKRLLASWTILGWKPLRLDILDFLWTTSFFVFFWSWLFVFLSSLLFFLCLWFSNNQRNSKCEQYDLKNSVLQFPQSHLCSSLLAHSGDADFCSFCITHILFLYLGLISRQLCIFQFLFWDRILMISSGENEQESWGFWFN